MRKNPVLFILYLVVGLYVFNLGILFLKIPESLSFLNKWFLMAGGVLVVFSSFRWLRDTYGSY